MRVWRAWLIESAVLLALVCPGRAAERTPQEVVATLNAALLDILKHADTLGYSGRFGRLKPVMQDTFDLAFMGEKSLGLRWKTLSDADRARWVTVFGDFTVANFAANFDHYAAQRFEVLGEEQAASDTRLVRTRVLTPGTEDVAFAYRLRATGDRWAIVDVYLKGTVSELALRRSEYESALDHQGFDALVAMIRGKIAGLAAGRGKWAGM
jgi:phospholipid transport system substrate-binding protein